MSRLAFLTVSVVLLLLWARHCHASEGAGYKLLDVDEVSVDAYKITGRRSAYQPGMDDKWTRGGQFNLNLRAGKYFAWENRLHFAGSDSKLMDAGWEWKAVFDKYRIQPFYWHHSEHALDESGAVSKFPLFNAYGLRIIFYRRGDR